MNVQVGLCDCIKSTFFFGVYKYRKRRFHTITGLCKLFGCSVQGVKVLFRDDKSVWVLNVYLLIFNKENDDTYLTLFQEF